MHGSQTRASGDPYFAHPIEVAGILTDYRLDTATIVTALLHDVIEDTPVTRKDIDGLFGPEVGELVEGVTKLSRLELAAEHTRQAENLRKFILAISKDVRVLMVKLADRLHNMRTLGFVNPAKRERISRETLDIYAPLARSIGCHRICTELEELSFFHLNPVARDAIIRRLDILKLEQGAAVAQVSGEIVAKLETAGITARVAGREKQPYSIWRKLQRKTIGFSQLSDIYAFRVIVDSAADCYAALGVIHRAWPCVPERFKDFISTPKRNNYRSLHTTVVGAKGMRIEMQIRTEAMDRVAEEGVAAHWAYKNESYGFDEEAMQAAGGRDPLANLRQLVQVLEHGGDADDLVEHAKMEMFLDQLFVFTPKGRLISLPKGAMPLDFAYAVHTNIGDTTVGVKVNGEMRPLRTTLVNGDVIEVIRGPKPAVPPDWRSLTITGRARSAIRRHIRQSEKEEYLRLGRVSIDQAIGRVGKSREGVSLRAALDRFGVDAEEDLLDAVGRGRITPAQVVEAIFPGLKDTEKAAAAQRRRIEDGPEARAWVRGSGLAAGVTLHFHKGCCPVPGDRIVGIMREVSETEAKAAALLAAAAEAAGVLPMTQPTETARKTAKGRKADETPPKVLDVHTIDCPSLAKYEDREDLWRDLQWTPEAERASLSRARLRATIENAPGVLGETCTIIGEAGGNIVNLNMHYRQGDFFDVDFDLDVKDARHLTHIAAALRACRSVETVDRARGV
jgi:GTP pyrophosphokinase/guanosine-3',5'-bis(diphosphate) 3'-pyrophosphohydrolase